MVPGCTWWVMVRTVVSCPRRFQKGFPTESLDGGVRGLGERRGCGGGAGGGAGGWGVGGLGGWRGGGSWVSGRGTEKKGIVCSGVF